MSALPPSPQPALPARFRRMELRLQTALILVFVLLTVPVTAIIVISNYQANKALIANHSEQFMYRSINDSYNATTKLFNPLLAAARTGAELMGDEPAYFRKPVADDFLHAFVDSNEAIHSAYAIFADGGTREVLRVTEGVKFQDRDPPPDAHFLVRALDARSARKARGRLRFHEPWGTEIGGFAFPALETSRIDNLYRNTFRLDSPNISDPYRLPASGQPGITVSAPARSRDGREIGMIAVDLTIATLARLVSQSRATPDSYILMIDREGRVIVPPDELPGAADRPAMPRVEDLKTPVILAAWTERLHRNEDRFTFRTGPQQTEYQCIFFPFDDSFRKPWELMMITPTDDFVGEINRTNRNIILFGLVAFAIQMALITWLSRSLSRPLGRLVDAIDRIRRFDFKEPQEPARSAISEIHYLFQATGLLARALESFTLYVPRGLVQKLLQTDIGTRRHVESRYLTMFFTDLEGFSTLSETEPQQQLLSRVSDYFSVITSAIERESGTVDKFIGDAVMAFWGAPEPLETHCYHACVAAVRTQRRMRRLNADWGAQKLPPLNVRIGIHCDAVLVGNVGSSERLSYTVMGDGVNVASRLEGMNKDFGTQSCVSHQVFREAGERLCLRPIDTITVKGRKSEVLVYELVAILDGDEEVQATEDEKLLCAMTREAYTHYAGGELEQAAQRYAGILERFPDDRVASRMLEKSRAARGS